MDGDASGRIKCTLANWTGVAYKIPRTEIEKCKNCEDLKWSGVYFLFGVSDDTGENIAYIGGWHQEERRGHTLSPYGA